jgi:hypothetical protein
MKSIIVHQKTDLKTEPFIRILLTTSHFLQMTEIHYKWYKVFLVLN